MNHVSDNDLRELYITHAVPCFGSPDTETLLRLWNWTRATRSEGMRRGLDTEGWYVMAYKLVKA